MKKVLLVDDDTIVRITLRSILDWNHYGYEMVMDASNGEQAFRWLQEHSADLLITDMKMPVMDGLELMQRLNDKHQLPVTVVLSSYDDFQMVREAFRLGAFDYLLKSDIKKETLEGLLAKLNTDSSAAQLSASVNPVRTQSDRLVDMVTGKSGLVEDFFQQEYYVVQFEIDDFGQQSVRFSANLDTELVEPVLEFARQIPRVANRCMIGSLSPARYVMLYQIHDAGQSRENVVSTCNQLKNVWKNYMNLPVSAGISKKGRTAADFFNCLADAGMQLELHHLKGMETVCYPWEPGQVSAQRIKQAKVRYERLFQGLKTIDEWLVEEGRTSLLQRLQGLSLQDSREECLAVIFLIVKTVQELYHNSWPIFQENVNYYEKIQRLEDCRSLEIWMSNYIRWILDDQTHLFDHRQADLMIRAKRFIADNYSNPELTLGNVAGYAGLNEKYFSSRFTREAGSTFSNYLTEVRIRKAKELMDKTDFKIYEVSQQVGYNNVEHFNRVFKKVTQLSPGAYKRKNHNEI